MSVLRAPLSGEATGSALCPIHEPAALRVVYLDPADNSQYALEVDGPLHHGNNQTPTDLVVKFQPVDTVDVILRLVLRLRVVYQREIKG